MAAVDTFVVDEADVEPARDDGDTASERLTFRVEHLEQRIIRFAPGRSYDRTAGSRHDLLYVVSGSGELELDGKKHVLEPGTSAFVAPGETWSVDNPGPGELLLVAVSATADLPVDERRRKRTIRFDDQPEHTASVERTFRYLVNQDAGCLDVTQFIGIVQPSKAPFHSHPYEELGYIVKGEGVAHVGGRSVLLRPGSCFHLPPEKVHCIENVGPGPMHILGVFHPSDSPANRVYQDNN
ncbi:MAG TPA: cupin domain-containing protein [Gaiellaceae bacterium]|nr:cupin domain-containing protein [Gaiellaceae bacterium]